MIIKIKFVFLLILLISYYKAYSYSINWKKLKLNNLINKRDL